MSLKPIEAGCMALVLPGRVRIPDLAGQSVQVVRLAEASERGSIGRPGNVWIIDNETIRDLLRGHSCGYVSCHESRLMRLDGGNPDALEPVAERELARVET